MVLRPVTRLLASVAGGAVTISLFVLACVGDDPPSTVAGTDVDGSTPDAGGADTSSAVDSGADTQPPPDAGADTGNPCGEIPTDPAASGGVCPPDGGVASHCPSGQFCCQSAGGSYPWICTMDPFDCIIDTNIDCNSTADCAGGKCCLTGNVTQGCPAAIATTRHSTCKGVCDVTEHELCTTNADCTQGTCHTAKLGYADTVLTATVGVCY